MASNRKWKEAKQDNLPFLTLNTLSGQPNMAETKAVRALELVHCPVRFPLSSSAVSAHPWSYCPCQSCSNSPLQSNRPPAASEALFVPRLGSQPSFSQRVDVLLLPLHTVTLPGLQGHHPARQIKYHFYFK